MRLSIRGNVRTALVRARRRLSGEEGFTMLIALGVLVVTSLLVAAAFAATQGDVHSSQHDIDAKRAYSGAVAGVNRFLYQLNQNTNYWETCPTQAKTAVPGSSTEKYSFTPVPANGTSSCSTTDPIGTMIDQNAGTFRMQFSGYSGTPEVSRSLIASFRRNSPLDYLWYTKYETLDPNTYANPSQFTDCAAFHRTPRPSHCVEINWVTGDVINGPMYTQDQYRICGSPVFGRSGSNDEIQSAAPSNPTYSGFGCSNNAQMNGDPRNPIANAPVIEPPPDNSELLADAQRYGQTFNGTTTIALSGTTATVTNCPSSCTTTTVNITQDPIIYVTNNTCTSTYSPYNVSYATTGGCGNVYVYGNYSAPLTIGSANDIIIGRPGLTSGNGTDDLTTNLAGTAMLGLVANNFVRVMHGISGTNPGVNNTCTASNLSYQTDASPVIDAAILAIQHSFIVDNYNCGQALGNLTVNGAIAQLFRGTVGTSGGNGVSTGYLKDYTYDDRLKSQEPPYLFDIAEASWHVDRETLCIPGSSAANSGCLP
jgi:hypothetical protein